MIVIFIIPIYGWWNEVQWLTQGHIATEWWSQDLNPDQSDSKCCTLNYCGVKVELKPTAPSIHETFLVWVTGGIFLEKTEHHKLHKLYSQSKEINAN